MRKILLILPITILAYFYFSLSTMRSEAASGFYISDEISVDGPALFYGVSGETRQELWSVYCAQPLRSCVARSAGLVLRIDDKGAPWLIAATLPSSRISIQERNYTQDAPKLFDGPLRADQISKLSGQDAFVIVEEHGRTVLRGRTTGLDRVINYLTWVQGTTARTLRDARLWPRDGDIRIENMSPEVLERYEVMQRRAMEGQRQLVPATKPQIEFAIKAQDGHSFYDPSGRGWN